MPLLYQLYGANVSEKLSTQRPTPAPPPANPNAVPLPATFCCCPLGALHPNLQPLIPPYTPPLPILPPQDVLLQLPVTKISFDAIAVSPYQLLSSSSQ